MTNKIGYLIVGLLYLIAIYAVILFLDPQLTATLTAEDNLIEYITSIGFFLTSGIFVLLFLRVRSFSDYTWLRKFSYLGLALLFFFGAGEEISWGQRIFNISTPESIASMNYQQELTVHNLSFFKDVIALSVGDLFSLFWLLFTFFIPLSAQFSQRLRSFYETFMPYVPWQFGILFILNWGLAKLGGVLVRAGGDIAFVVHDLVETKESNYAVLFVLVAVYLYYTTYSKAKEENYL
jgi:hypothetical protein